MKKNTFFLTAGIGAVAALLVGAPLIGIQRPVSAALTEPTRGYLTASLPNDWAAMALAAHGESFDASFLATIDDESANGYATYILAITAFGKDPRAFGTTDYVFALHMLYHNGQFGDESMLSDDMFAVLALRSAGEQAQSARVQQSVALIKEQQAADGSWNWGMNAPEGSVDYTALGILTLISGGVSETDTAIINATQYLLAAQNDDGGFGFMPGEPSNSSSTAWVVWALNALSEDIAFWKPAEDTPIDYLNSLFQENGYIAHSAQTIEANAFSPVATAYAAIALSGSFLPVASIAEPPFVSIRIEGSVQTLCTASVHASSALDAIKVASGPCSYTYVIEDTQYGPYLTTIAGEAAAGFDGWSYRANDALPDVGAADFALQYGDTLVWYYGAWDDALLRVRHEVHADVNATTQAVIERYDGTSWQGAPGALLMREDESFTADDQGIVALSWPQEGVFALYADAAAHVRSERVRVLVGVDPALSQSVPISVEVIAHQSDDQNEEEDGDGVVFGVSGDLNFGQMRPGEQSHKSLTLSNGGPANLDVRAEISGSSFFDNYASIDGSSVSAWGAFIASGAEHLASVALSLPQTFASFGTKQGTLIFWATPVSQ